MENNNPFIDENYKIMHYILPCNNTIMMSMYNGVLTDIELSTPTISTTTVTISKNDMIKYWKKHVPVYHYHYFTRKVEDWNLEEIVLKDEIRSLWMEYVSNNKTNWEKWLYALTSEFSPIENVDEYSEKTLSYRGTEENRKEYEGKEVDEVSYNGQQKNELVHSGTETNTTTPTGSSKTTTTNANSPEDNNTFYNTEKSETVNTFTNMQTENKTEFTNRKDTNTQSFNDRNDVHEKEFLNRYDKDTKSFNDREDVEVIRRHGNIGVTKSSELVLDYLKLYHFNLTEMIILDFLNKYFSIGEETFRIEQ